MKRRAFTLIETILAISLSAIVMLACAELVFNIVKTSSRIETAWSLEAHADGVERFLRASFMNSCFTDTSKISDIIFRRNTASLLIARLPEEENTAKYYLAFSDKSPHPLYFPATEVSPEKLCFLQFAEDDGLYVVWRFINSEDRENAPLVYRTPLSRHVAEVSYLYKGAGQWKETAQPDATMEEMPSFIKITFADGDRKITRVIPLGGQIDFQISR